MKRAICIALATAVQLAVPSCAADHLLNFLPRHDLAGYIVRNFDIRSIRSGLNPRRTAMQAHFSDLQMRPTRLAKDKIVFDESDWTTVIQILGRGDFNNDGIEDVIICFSDSAKKGTYRDSEPLLLTQYSRTSPLIAIAYEVSNPGCPKIPR